LYRDKFKFQAIDAGVHLGVPQFPTGHVREDKFFGRQTIYTSQVVIRIPYNATQSTKDLRLRITAQGCNEPIGVCYPPITSDVRISTAASTTKESPYRATGSAANLAKTLLQAKDDDVIDPEKAFQVTAAAIDKSTIAVRFIVDDCCYLYRDKMRFALATSDRKTIDRVKLDRYELPAGDGKTDEFFGTTRVYHGTVDVRLPIRADPSVSDFLLNVTYQGCAEKGVKICYPPTTRALPISLSTPSANVGPNAPAPNDSSGNLLAALLAAFASGLLLTFTPCVLPMVPILSGVIVGAEGERLTRLRGGFLSYVYVLGTAFTYAIAGAIAGATGEQLQAYFQNAWAIGIFSAILLLLALSMFGFYELQVPAAIQSLLHKHSAKLHQRAKSSRIGETVGVFLLGAVSALIIGACVSPVLVTAIGSAVASGDAWRGALVMFALAHGQGAILVAIGVSEGFLLPRAGPWMEKVKHFFGVLLIAAAVYLLGALPQVPVMFLWSALFIVCAVYLGATQALPKEARGWQFFQKGVGVVLLVWGIVAMLGGFLGSRDVLQPLPFDRIASGSMNGQLEHESPFRRVRSLVDLDAALADARLAGKPAILDYYATWCADCVRMERSTFLDPRVRATIADRFAALQADVTDTNDPGVAAIKRRFNVFGPPAVLFFDADGHERPDLKVYGYKSDTEFLAILSRL
jgi:thioredoxin:protein disulfide reductase